VETGDGLSIGTPKIDGARVRDLAAGVGQNPVDVANGLSGLLA